jgi:hypothetical protein
MGVFGPGASPGEFPIRADRRRQSRLELGLNADLIGSSPRPPAALLHGNALDVSRTGLRLRFWFDAPVGSVFSVRLFFLERPSVCRATVQWRFETVHGFVYGVRVDAWELLDDALSSRFDAAN